MLIMNMRACNLSVEVKLPATYEALQLALWKLGLEHDPTKYTLGVLYASFSANEDVEQKIAELANPDDTLDMVAAAVNYLLFAPDDIQAKLIDALMDDEVEDIEDFICLYSHLLDADAKYRYCFYFPLECELHHPEDGSAACQPEKIFEYAGQINIALQMVQMKLFQNIANMIRDTDDDCNAVLEYILRAEWDVAFKDEQLQGRVCVEMPKALSDEEIAFLTDWIWKMNRDVLNPRMAKWSVLTSDGLFFVSLWKDEPEFGVSFCTEESGELPEVEETTDEDMFCICPDCMARRNREQQMGEAQWLEMMDSAAH